MAQATLELIINGSVGAGFSSMMSQVKGAAAEIKKAWKTDFDLGGLGKDLGQLKLSEALAAERRLLKKEFKETLLPFGGLITSLTLATKSAIDFEESFAEVKKVLDGSDEEILSLRSNLLALGGELPLSAKGINEIAAAAGQMGIALKDIPDFTRFVGQAASVFDMKAGDAGEMFGRIASLYNVPLEDLQRRVGDPINQLSNTMQAKAKDIGEVLVRIAGAANNFGLTAEQATSLSAALLDMGNDASTAATGLNAIMRRLQSGDAATKKFKDALEQLGLTTNELKEMMKEPEKGLLQFLQTIQKIDKSDRSSILTAMFGGEHQAKVATMVSSMEKYQKAIAGVAQSQGAFDKEWQARKETTANDLQVLRNSLTSLAISIGDVLTPVVSALATTLAPVLRGLADFLGRNKTLTTVLVVLGSALIAGKVAFLAYGFAMNMVATSMLFVTKIFAVGGAVLKTVLIPAIKMVGTAIAFVGRLLLLNPIGLLITGIATAAFLIYKYWEPIKKFFSGLWATIKSVLSGLYEKMVSFGAHLIEGLIAGLKKAGGAVWNAIKGVGETVKGAFKSVLGINSPSKVFQGFGQNIGQGLILGVNATKGAANRAMSELANPRLKSGGAGFAGGAAGNMRITYSPTINLAGAAENVKREVSDALKNSQVEFEKMFKRMVTQNERRALVW